MTSFFEPIELAPVDPIFGVAYAFARDERAQKINLGVGSYKTAALKPLVLESVKKAELLLPSKEPYKEYLPIEGDPLFLQSIYPLVLGTAVEKEKVALFQCVGGTGALRLGGNFLKKAGFQNIVLPEPSWDNHRRIFSHAELVVSSYPYYDKEKKKFDFAELMRALFHFPARSVVLFQGCCHNPTGCDPTLEEWKEIAKACQKHSLLPFFDFAYQGFGEGIEEDCAPLRHFAERGLEFLLATSYSKNFGLYAERVGALFIVCKGEEEAKRVGSQGKVLIRGLYSNPPCHGSRIIATILQDVALKRLWEEEVARMRGRIVEMRGRLVEALLKRGKGEFAAIGKQKGMFSYTGLDEKAVEALIREHGIYLPFDGRINVAGINDDNLATIADALAHVSR